jgi:hypothetical protein
MIHEFIADSACVADGDTESFATMLLHAYDEGRYLDPSHSFFHSPIKRRLVMITSSNRSFRHLLRKALVLPLNYKIKDGSLKTITIGIDTTNVQSPQYHLQGYPDNSPGAN